MRRNICHITYSSPWDVESYDYLWFNWTESMYKKTILHNGNLWFVPKAIYWKSLAESIGGPLIVVLRSKVIKLLSKCRRMWLKTRRHTSRYYKAYRQFSGVLRNAFFWGRGGLEIVFQIFRTVIQNIIFLYKKYNVGWSYPHIFSHFLHKYVTDDIRYTRI